MSVLVAVFGGACNDFCMAVLLKRYFTVAEMKNGFAEISAMRLFTLWWALAFFIDDPRWQRPWLALIYLTFFGFTLFIKEVRMMTALIVVFSTGVILYSYPIVANHMNLALFANLFLLFILLRYKDFPPGTARVLLAALAIVYIWAGLHKINADFLDEKSSCVSSFLERYDDRYAAGPPVPGFVRAHLGYLIVAWEIGSGLLLLFARTSGLGVVLALGLHAFLVPVGFVNFATFCMGVQIYALMTGSILTPRARTALKRASLFFMGFMILAALALFFEKFQRISVSKSPVYLAEVILWMQMAGVVIYQVIASRLRLTGEVPAVAAPSVLRPFARWALPTVVAIFGSFNYWGLSTVGTFSMFSNVQTEGHYWNHLLFPKAMRIFHYQDEIYFGVPSATPGVPALRARRVGPGTDSGAPPIEIYRAYQRGPSMPGVATLQGLHLTTKENPGEIRSANELFPQDQNPYSWWEMKLFGFRPVQAEGKNQCRW